MCKMAIENKRMQQRYGTYSKFQIEKSKLLPNEFASVTSGDPKSSDGKGLYFAFAPGEAKQLMTYEDGKQMIDGATDEIKEGFLDDINEATTAANSATSKANAAASNADIKAQEAANAAEDARGVIDQITKDSYLHTTTQTFVDTVKASPTAYGNAIPEQIEGYIKQDTTKGLQLFDASCLSASKTQGGATVVNNGDGSFTVSGDGNLTENFSMSYNLSHEDSLKLFPVGTYQITRKQIRPSFFVQIRGGRQHTISSISKPGDVLSILEEDTQNPDYYIQFLFYGNAIDTIKPGTIKPMAWASAEVPQDADWEPYTGGQPSPNPDYPQIVHGVGDMGFFDGELLQGYYQVSDGTFKPATVALCNKNPIPCKPGDKIIFEYEDVINGSGISIFFYKSDGTFISRVNKVGVRKIEGVAPQDTTYCNIVINPVSEPIPVASAKHITVTINDKYAVCVKSKGKNLLNLTGEILYSFGRETIFDNQVTINPTTDGRTAPGVWFILGDIKKFLGKTIYVKADAIQRSGNYNPRMLLMTIKGNTSVRTYLTYSYSKAGQVMSVKIPDDLDTNEVSDLALNMYVNDGSSQVDADAYAIFTNVYAGLSEPTNEFVPYQSNVTYIPVDYPLFEGDKIVRRNGEYRVLRDCGMKAYDGSDDEKWFESNKTDYQAFGIAEEVKSGAVKCDRFMYIPNNTVSSGNAIGIGTARTNNRIYVANGISNNLSEFKTWLKSNPITVVYQLVAPTDEPLPPESQKALYSIMACDEQTEIEIAGVPSDAEIQNQFLLPRNEDGALNTTAYCTAKRNEIALEELENATAARLSALETQALQEV